MKLLRLFFAATLILLFVCPVYGDEVISDELYNAADFDAEQILDAIPKEVLDKLPYGDVFSSEGFRDAFSFEYFFGVAVDVLCDTMMPALKSLSSTLGLVLVASGLAALKNTLRSDSLVSLFEFVSGLCIMLSLYSTASGLAQSVSVYLTQLSTLMYAVIPVMIGIGSAGGNLTSSTVSANAMMLGITFVETLAAEGLFPVLQLCMGLSIASGVGSGLKLGGISKLVRGLFTKILAFVSAAISAVMTFQTSIASRADSLSMRAMKFAASSSIPVVGGIAGDAIGAVAESLALVRGTVGWVGVIIIAVMTLPVTVEILLVRLGIIISETAADILGLDREKSLLGEMSGFLGFLAAVSIICGLMFVYGMALFARSVTAISVR